MKYILIVLVLLFVAIPASAVNNPYGVHMLDSGSQIQNWAKSLTGSGGYCKQLFMGITNNTQGPSSGWANFVQGCYNRQMIPVCRLATNYNDGQWNAPVPNSPGNYSNFAQAVKRVVQGLPRNDTYPLYIEILNEVNSTKEWGGTANAWEYAHCLVDCASAIRSIGDSRIKILNAGLAGGAGFADQMFTQVPESLWAFDVYACHCYALNAPPELNYHNGNPAYGDTIDSYLNDLQVIASHGRTGVQVMITETGWAIGDNTYSNFPIINEDNRADYIMRAFRDGWSKWPEVLAVTPFEFVGNGWPSYDWVYPDSGSGSLDRPTDAHKQYYDVWNLAKPNMTRGCISGYVKESAFSGRLTGATVTLDPGGYTTTTDNMGNYFFPNNANITLVSPGTYTLTANKTGFANQVISNVTVSAAENVVVNFSLPASGKGSISGHVVDSITGLGLKGVSVLTTPSFKSAATDSNGNFIIQNLTPSNYTLGFTKYGFRSYTSNTITVATDNTSVIDLCLAPGQDPGRVNKILNTDFEYGGGSQCSGVANAWCTLDNLPHDANFALDTAVRFSGTASQRITPNIPYSGGWDWLGQWSGYGSVIPGSTYKYQVWCKTTDASSDGTQLSLVLSKFGETTDAVYAADPVMTSTNGWTLLQGYVTVPITMWNGSSGRLRVQVKAAATGTTWIDRAFACDLLLPVIIPAAPANQISATPGQGNVALSWRNGSLSTGTIVVCRTDRYPLTYTDGTVLADVAGTAGNTSSYVHSGLQVGTRYYYSIFGHAAGPTLYSDPIFASGEATDNTAPVSVTVTDDGAYTSSTNTLHAVWSASDPESNITGYEYAIGTTPTGTDVIGWTSAGTGTSVNRSGLALQNGQSYYFSVRATNGVGLTTTANSDGIKAASSVSNIGEAKKLSDGTFILLEDKALTAGAGAISGMVYVQEQNRSAGIGVSIPSTTIATGTLVDVSGTLSGFGSERMLTDGTVSSKTTTVTLKPLAISPALLWGYDAALSLLNQGLLVKTYGRVAFVGSDYFMLNTYAADKTLKVCAYGYSKPSYDDFVAVTGVVGAEGSGVSAVPVLRLRNGSDWRQF